MAKSTSAAASVADIESQIAKVSAELEKARSQAITATQTSLGDLKKNAADAKTKFVEMSRSTDKTAAAKAKLKAAKVDAADQANAYDAAVKLLKNLKADQKIASELAKALKKTSKTKKNAKPKTNAEKKVKQEKKRKQQEEQASPEQNAKDEKKATPIAPVVAPSAPVLTDIVTEAPANSDAELTDSNSDA